MGHPQAALFALSIALVFFNVLSTVKAALGAVHGSEVVRTEVSGSDLAEEVSATHRGMMVAVPEDEWVDFGRLSARELADWLRQWARLVQLPQSRKQPRGPQKPRPRRTSGAKVSHVATSRLLKGQQK